MYKANKEKDDIKDSYLKALGVSKDLIVNGYGFPYHFLKRTIDVIGATVGLLLLWPLFLLIGLLIKIDSRGPIFYKQKRCSEGLRIFWIYKFRTMPVGVENGTPVWAKENDSRSTRLGLYLRHWHFDELPQLINVLKGEMSLVGPRPERPYFIKNFRKTIPDYDTRHRVKAGLTGWAQLNGHRGDSSVKERIKHDHFYADNWSLIFDIKILFKTIFGRDKLWIHSLVFSQKDLCPHSKPSQTPTRKAKLKATK